MLFKNLDCGRKFRFIATGDIVYHKIDDHKYVDAVGAYLLDYWQTRDLRVIVIPTEDQIANAHWQAIRNAVMNRKTKIEKEWDKWFRRNSIESLGIKVKFKWSPKLTEKDRLKRLKAIQ